jgi:hypothetical protein
MHYVIHSGPQWERVVCSATPIRRYQKFNYLNLTLAASDDPFDLQNDAVDSPLFTILQVGAIIDRNNIGDMSVKAFAWTTLSKGNGKCNFDQTNFFSKERNIPLENLRLKPTPVKHRTKDLDRGDSNLQVFVPDGARSTPR